MQRLVAGALVFGCLLGLVWLNSHLSKDVRVVAHQLRMPSGQVEIGLDDTGSVTSDGQRSGVVMHEVFHSLKSLGLCDYDIPMAAASGYYTEWLLDGRLSDPARSKDFSLGQATSLLDGSLEIALQKYRVRYVKEDIQSYSTGAMLAGILAKEFGKDNERAHMFLFGLAIGLTVKEAVVLANDRAGFMVVKNLREGVYTYIDETAFRADSSRLMSPSAKIAADYLSTLRHDYVPTYRLGHQEGDADLIVTDRPNRDQISH